MSVLPAYLCTTYSAGADGSQKKTLDSLELDLLVAMSLCVGAESSVGPSEEQ